MSNRLPSWMRQKAPSPSVLEEMKALLDGLSLHTVCESAECPNQGRCFSRGTATLLIMGNICTRNCRFCAVKKGEPFPINPDEPKNVAQVVSVLKLKHVVVTSVTRDDLPDGGAAHFVQTINAIRQANPQTTIEVLIPDFQGSIAALKTVINSFPEIINHNLETVLRLYSEVRPRADYQRSLELLKQVKENAPRIVTKSGLMLGMGEKHIEVVRVMKDLRRVGCDLLTLGQYLRPSINHYPVHRYVPPSEFEEYQAIALGMGFSGVASAPLVRSSFDAAGMYDKLRPKVQDSVSEFA